jgi:hypothetical protein
MCVLPDLLWSCATHFKEQIRIMELLEGAESSGLNSKAPKVRPVMSIGHPRPAAVNVYSQESYTKIFKSQGRKYESCGSNKGSALLYTSSLCMSGAFCYAVL